MKLVLGVVLWLLVEFSSCEGQWREGGIHNPSIRSEVYQVPSWRRSYNLANKRPYGQRVRNRIKSSTDATESVSTTTTTPPPVTTIRPEDKSDTVTTKKPSSSTRASLKNINDPNSPYALIHKYFVTFDASNITTTPVPTLPPSEVNNEEEFNPNDLGGLDESEVFLVDGSLLVIRGGEFPDNHTVEEPAQPLDDYQAPYREPKLPPPDFDFGFGPGVGPDGIPFPEPPFGFDPFNPYGNLQPDPNRNQSGIYLPPRQPGGGPFRPYFPQGPPPPGFPLGGPPPPGFPLGGPPQGPYPYNPTYENGNQSHPFSPLYPFLPHAPPPSNKTSPFYPFPPPPPPRQNNNKTSEYDLYPLHPNPYYPEPQKPDNPPLSKPPKPTFGQPFQTHRPSDPNDNPYQYPQPPVRGSKRPTTYKQDPSAIPNKPTKPSSVSRKLRPFSFFNRHLYSSKNQIPTTSPRPTTSAPTIPSQVTTYRPRSQGRLRRPSFIYQDDENFPRRQPAKTRKPSFRFPQLRPKKVKKPNFPSWSYETHTLHTVNPTASNDNTFLQQYGFFDFGKRIVRKEGNPVKRRTSGKQPYRNTPPISLHKDTLVNFKNPLPPINPLSEPVPPYKSEPSQYDDDEDSRHHHDKPALQSLQLPSVASTTVTPVPTRKGDRSLLPPTTQRVERATTERGSTVVRVFYRQGTTQRGGRRPMSYSYSW